MANILNIAALGRFINRRKLLVVMYHGITDTLHEPPVWTQLPVNRFEAQLKFLGKHYKLLSLKDVLNTIASGVEIPEKAALITFDDGLKNNYTIAFPILRKMKIPAVVFLTVDYIGSNEILWVDELYMLLRESTVKGIRLELSNVTAQRYFAEGNIWKCYETMVETLKRSGFEKRTEAMEKLRGSLPTGLRACDHDFRMLDWDEVRSMYASGLFDFGVHTATHRILSELSEEEWEWEIVAPKFTLEREIGTEIASFCFPNGKPGIDFSVEHCRYLRDAGFRCAFTTQSSLFDWQNGDPLQIGRVAAGNDLTSDMDYFRINTSGAISLFKRA